MLHGLGARYGRSGATGGRRSTPEPWGHVHTRVPHLPRDGEHAIQEVGLAPRAGIFSGQDPVDRDLELFREANKPTRVG